MSRNLWNSLGYKLINTFNKIFNTTFYILDRLMKHVQFQPKEIITASLGRFFNTTMHLQTDLINLALIFI